jgi:hypothetical protein
MNPTQPQFPTSNVKVIKNAAHAYDEYGYEPEEYEDTKGVKLDYMGQSDVTRQNLAADDDMHLAIRNRKAKEAGKTPTLKFDDTK